MQRTTLIASVTLSSLLVAGIAWAGSTARDTDHRAGGCGAGRHRRHP